MLLCPIAHIINLTFAGKFKRNTTYLYARKWIWKYRLRNGDHFLSVSTCFKRVIGNSSTSRLSIFRKRLLSLRWRHNDHADVSNHQPHGCLLNRLFRRKSKKTSKLRVTGHCAGNSPGTGEFPAQMASYAENISIWWRHHDKTLFL